MANFIFDETSSHQFGLVIGEINGSGLKTSNVFSEMEILSDNAFDRIEPYYYGRRFKENLKFSLTIVSRHSERYFLPFEIDAVQEWLFGRKEPKLLSIITDFGVKRSFECWLNNPAKIYKSYERVVGWTFDVECTSPFAITESKEKSYNCSMVENEIEYFNFSTVEDYIYPKMTIKLDPSTSYIRIENTNDNGRVFQLSGVKSGETIYVDNNLKYIETESKLNILDKFNNNFFRFVDGLNVLKISGKCELTFENRFYKNMGGF